MTEASATPWQRAEFSSQGAILRGRLYLHAGPPGPIVLMTHGYSATISGMVADRYAEVIHAAGLNVLLFDHRGFGVSDGPRHLINRWIQSREYSDAIDFVISRPEVDATRIAIWGDSLSGSAAIGAAAFDERVRALVVQVPACGSESPPPDPDGSLFGALRDAFFRADVESKPEQTIGPMAVVSADQDRAPSLLSPITAFRWFTDYGGRPGTDWANEATHVVADTPVPYHAALCAPHLRGASMWVIARDDEMPGAEPAVAHLAFDAAPQPKNLLEIEGGHFGLLYHPSPLFDRVSAVEAIFLAEHLAI